VDGSNPPNDYHAIMRQRCRSYEAAVSGPLPLLDPLIHLWFLSYQHAARGSMMGERSATDVAGAGLSLQSSARPVL
jgi:hypothetical protein